MLFRRLKLLHHRWRTNNLVELLAERAEPGAVRKKYKSVLPPNKFATHRDDRSVRVDRAAFVQELCRDIDVVQNNEWLSENCDSDKIPCIVNDSKGRTSKTCA